MPSIVFDVHTVGVGCKDQVCKFLFIVMCAVAGQVHVNWRYRTLRLGVIRQGYAYVYAVSFGSVCLRYRHRFAFY